MSYDVPPRQTVLGCSTPRELFGDALDDPRSLKRAYAALAKAYRAGRDDEVFQHVRSLYDAARARPAPTAAPVVDPGARLRQAVTAGEAGAVVELLCDELGELVAACPDEVARALQFLVMAAGPWLTADARAVVEAALARPELRLHPGMAELLGADLVVLEALDAAEVDPVMPEGFVEALRRAWRQPAVDVARAWLAAPALSDQAVDELVPYLDEEHPAVLGVMQRQALRMRQGGAPHLDVDEVERLCRRYPTQVELRHDPGGQAVFLGLWCLLFMGAMVSTIGHDFDLVWIIGVSVAGMAVAWWPIRALRRHAVLRGWRQVLALGTDELVALCRERGMWPAELVHELTWDDALPIGTTGYGPGHPVLTFRADPGGPWKVLGPPHLARLEAAAEGDDG